MRFAELPLSAQTACAELFEQTRTRELSDALAGLVGSFHKLARKGQAYWYFAYRDLGQKVRMAYVGPDDARVRGLVERFKRVRRGKPLAPMAQAALELGCAPTAPKHFRIIRRPAECGFFRAGGVLIGTHASPVSSGTERMRVAFGKAGFIDKARRQPDKVRQVIEKIRTDGLMATLDAVRAKLDEPMPMGYCNVGTVIGLGAGVQGFQLASAWPPTAGTPNAWRCRRTCAHGCPMRWATRRRERCGPS